MVCFVIDLNIRFVDIVNNGADNTAKDFWLQNTVIDWNNTVTSWSEEAAYSFTVNAGKRILSLIAVFGDIFATDKRKKFRIKTSDSYESIFYDI